MFKGQQEDKRVLPGESKTNSFKSRKNQEPEPNKGQFAGTVHEAVMSDFHEPGRQHMLEKAPEKLNGIESDLSGAVAPGFAIKRMLPAALRRQQCGYRRWPPGRRKGQDT
ncbi:MAG: hypothetical protein VR65_05860 [Desulfobulbaceae bacterium BRH_c16a]|nr:MAG: hypothetical protein VR65_05860 [Desulfobulbaceae bacterium BRH_c16a]